MEKRKKNIKQKVFRTLANVIETSTKEYLDEWPPHCTQILHQPNRPKKK